MRALVDGLLDFLWPAACPGCLREATVDRVCRDCSESFVRWAPGERRREGPRPLEQVVALFRYSDPVRAMVLELKYGGNVHGASALGFVLAEETAGEVETTRPDAVVPIPLHWRRRRARGFNQAELLAAPVAELLAVPLLPRLLRRTRATAPQASLSGRARRRNLGGAFVADGVVGRSVLLVDDVTTTGTTLVEAAVVLREAGARRVAALVVCRAEDS